MYLARVDGQGRTRWELRRSVQCAGGLSYEVLFDLGEMPQRYVRSTRHGFAYADELSAALEACGHDVGELDDVLADVIPSQSGGWGPSRRPWVRTVITSDVHERILALHPFDRRRMAFLRSGEVDLRRIDHVHPKLFRSLLDKSRDELEQVFLRMERDLAQEELRPYVYGAFNLQRFFSSPVAPSRPEAMDQERLDEVFVCELCALDDNAEFWRGYVRTARMPVYLQRYVWMFFDHEFSSADEFEQIFQRFMNDFRRPQARVAPVSTERMSDLFGHPAENMRRMTRRELTTLFRKQAMRMHPDQGGDHDQFVELLGAYKQLLRSLRE